MRFGCNTDEKVQFGKRSPIAFHCIASQRHERPFVTLRRDAVKSNRTSFPKLDFLVRITTESHQLKPPT